MSSTRAVAAAASPIPATAPASFWILGTWQDLAFIIGTPLLALALFGLARARMGLEDIAMYVMAFGAVGHHLPGMLRAYGDRALFERYRTRFIVAPLGIGAACFAFTYLELSAITLALLLWGTWHGLMQTYGFGRIYDAKVHSFAKRTQRLDLALCIAWFVTPIIVSPRRLFQILANYHLRIGAPVPSAAVIHGLQVTALAGTAVVTLVYLGNLFVSWRAGARPSALKLLLFATSFAFWWYTTMVISNMVARVAMFELFHDTQYLAIVWAYNRARAEKGSAGTFTTFLFRRSGIFVGIYVGLCAAYGSLRLVQQGLEPEMIQKGLTSVLAASTLLHFYYDGFIWKVREKGTAEALGIDRSGAPAKLRLAHAVKWAPIVVLLVVFGFLESARRTGNSQRLQALSASLPEIPDVHRAMGDALKQFGRNDEAIEQYLAAFALGSDSSALSYKLGSLLTDAGRHAKALPHLTRARQLKAGLEGASRKAAEAHHGLALSLAGRGELGEAESHYRQALLLAPDSAATHLNLAGILAELGRPDEAIGQYHQAGELYLSEKNLDMARSTYERLLALRPEAGRGHYLLGTVLEAQGDGSLAIDHYLEALRCAPELESARQRLEALRGLESARADGAARRATLGARSHRQW